MSDKTQGRGLGVFLKVCFIVWYLVVVFREVRSTSPFDGCGVLFDRMFLFRKPIVQ